MTRTKPAEQRRAELLAAGQALFLAKGIAGTSLDDITQRAGVSKGLFYLYFASKEDLVLALREQFSRDLAERMRAAVEAVPASTAGPALGRPPRRLRPGRPRALPGSARPARGPVPPRPRDSPDPESPDPYCPDPEHDGPASRPGQPDPAPAPAARVIRELLEAGAAAGAFDVPDPESTAVLCYASMHAFDHDFRGRPGPDDTRLIRAAQQLFRRAAGLP